VYEIDDAPLTQTDVVPADVWRIFWAETRARSRATVGALPDHFALIEAIRGRAVMGESAARTPKGRSFQLSEEALQESTRVLFDTAMARRNNQVGMALRGA